MELRIYQIETIMAIRKQGSAFNEWSDIDIAHLYRQWSNENYAAGWINYGAVQFYKWATISPIDAYIESERRVRI
jgi:hypothetical protein